MQKVIFITGNEYKYAQAKAALAGTDIELIRQKLDTPEIQSTNIEEVAAFSSHWAAKELNQPVIVSDVGYYFQGLNGFPGPFIKYVNQWFTAEDYLKLLENKKDRIVLVKQCLSFCSPGEKPINFLGQVQGTISKNIGTVGVWKTPINQIFIPDGYTKIVGELSVEEAAEFWNRDTTWIQFVNYLKSNK